MFSWWTIVNKDINNWCLCLLFYRNWCVCSLLGSEFGLKTVDFPFLLCRLLNSFEFNSNNAIKRFNLKRVAFITVLIGFPRCTIPSALRKREGEREREPIEWTIHDQWVDHPLHCGQLPWGTALRLRRCRQSVRRAPGALCSVHKFHCTKYQTYMSCSYTSIIRLTSLYLPFFCKHRCECNESQWIAIPPQY